MLVTANVLRSLELRWGKMRDHCRPVVELGMGRPVWIFDVRLVPVCSIGSKAAEQA